VRDFVYVGDVAADCQYDPRFHEVSEPIVNATGSQSVAAIVLAGGFGTRLRELYPGIPKPMIPVAGRPFLDWVLLHLREHGISEAVTSAGYLGNVIADYYRVQPISGVAVTVAEESQPLGTAGGFLHALRHTNAADLLVVNGDSLALAPIRDFIAGSDTAAVLGVEVEDSSRYGALEIGAGGRLLGFKEKRSGAGMVNAGVYFVRRATLDEFPQKLPLSFETEVFPALVAAGCEIRVDRCRAPFLDIGTPGSLAEVASFIESHLASKATL
jgi:D-glycero-alpha-D-manno-heptose 1-phosphate guanylyltransferase